MTNKEKAYLHFFPECNGKCREGWCLHHIDKTIKHTDKKRYYEWRIADLMPMTMLEHSVLHLEDLRNKTLHPMLGKHPSFETILKLKEAKRNNPPCGMKGKHHSEETKEKMSVSHKGINTWMLGKHFLKETKQKLSLMKQGCHWWNNGVEEMYQKECPADGWTLGRITHTRVHR